MKKIFESIWYSIFEHPKKRYERKLKAIKKSKFSSLLIVKEKEII